MKRDRFDDILRSKLQDSETGHAVPAWGEMERRLKLSENAAGLPAKKRLASGIKYGIAASVALLLGLGIYQFGQHTGQMVADLGGDTTLPGLKHALTADMLMPASSEPLNDPDLEKIFKSIKSITPISQAQSALNPLNKQGIAFAEESASPVAAWADPNGISFDDPENRKQIDGEQPSAQRNGNTPAPAYSLGDSRKASYRNGFDWNRGTTRSKRRQWMASAYASTYAAGGSDVKLLTSPSAFNAALVESNYTKNAVSFMGQNPKHHFPISVGFNVRRNLTKRLGIETGLVYSYLESSAELNAEYTYKYKQKLHYLGIPLNLSYSLYQRKKLDVYLMGGAMAEFALSASGSTRIFNKGEFASEVSQDLPAKGLLWSVGLGAGISYDFVDNFGMYLEPGANYYFNNPDQPISYRTDNPWSFNVRIGFRFKF